MPITEPYRGAPKLVLAFDVGTTFSSVAYCILYQGEIPEIKGVIKYPAQKEGQGDAKVPSVLYYDKSGAFKAAGAAVLSDSVLDEAAEGEWTRAEWWKLHLRPKHLPSSISQKDGLPPLPLGKSAVDVLTDFIGYLFRCTKAYIEEHHRAFVWPITEGFIEYIFTHPNGWEGIQQQMYRRAIEDAGLVSKTPEGRSHVHMLTEGEASLHFCVANLVKTEMDSQTTQGVVIIDAGGGTIDLSMFSMMSNPISCNEIAPAECRLQGSVFVTRRAGALLKRKLEGWENLKDGDIDEFTREFDRTTKLVIKSDQEIAYLKVGGRRVNNAEYNIARGMLKLSGEEAVGLFSDSIRAITDAFEQQQKYAKMQVAMAFLVGGLSTNDWLWSQLQSYFASKDIAISRPDDHINKAVAYGAVLSHIDLDNHLIGSRVAHSTYGVLCSLPVKENDREHMRRKHQWESDPSGEHYVPGYFEMKLCKGATLNATMEFKESFSLTETDPANFGMQNVRLTCYRGTLSDPKWVDQDQSSFYTLGIVRADLSVAENDMVKKTTPGGILYQLDYDVIIYYGLTELKAELGWKSKGVPRRVPLTVSYEE